MRINIMLNLAPRLVVLVHNTGLQHSVLHIVVDLGLVKDPRMHIPAHPRPHIGVMDLGTRYGSFDAIFPDRRAYERPLMLAVRVRL